MTQIEEEDYALFLTFQTLDSENYCHWKAKR